MPIPLAKTGPLTRHVFAEQPECVVGGSQAGSKEGDNVGVAQLRRIRGGETKGAAGGDGGTGGADA